MGPCQGGAIVGAGDRMSQRAFFTGVVYEVSGPFRR
jgi:hypothetical protein